MLNRLGPLALAAAIALGGWPPATSAAAPESQTIGARIDIRAAVAVAMADGVLSPEEGSIIFLRANRVLTKAEVDGLRRWLERLCAAKPRPQQRPGRRVSFVAPTATAPKVRPTRNAPKPPTGRTVPSAHAPSKRTAEALPLLYRQATLHVLSAPDRILGDISDEDECSGG